MKRRNRLGKAKLLKRGQVEVTFNWFYVLIAGGVILLFFVGIVFKQKAASEEQLSVEVVRVMQSIFTAAGVSEKTKNAISLGAISQEEIYFDCQEGVTTYGLSGHLGKAQEAITPLFAPLTLQTPTLILWSLPYKFPYKVIDFLFVTSPDIKYFLIGSDVTFVNEFMNATDDSHSQLRFNRQYLVSLEDTDPGESMLVRFVDVDGSHIRSGQRVPEGVLRYEDSLVSAVVFTPGHVNFYRKEGEIWRNEVLNLLPLLSLGGERDAAKYAAIFAGDAASYQCNMQKAFKRLALVNQVYAGTEIGQRELGGKLAIMRDYYIAHPEILMNKPECLLTVSSDPQESLADLFSVQQNQVSLCELSFNSCASLVETARVIQEKNEDLERVGCITLY